MVTTQHSSWASGGGISVSDSVSHRFRGSEREQRTDLETWRGSKEWLPWPRPEASELTEWSEKEPPCLSCWGAKGRPAWLPCHVSHREGQRWGQILRGLGVWKKSCDIYLRMKLLKDFKQENNEIGFSFVILCSAWFVEMDERQRRSSGQFSPYL